MTFSNAEPSGSQRRGRKRQITRYPEIDRYVSTALSLEKIARRYGGLGSKGNVWNYYKRTDQLPIRRRDKPLCREEISYVIRLVINEMQQQISYVLGIAQTLVYSRASDAEKRIYEHFQYRPRSCYNWGTLEEAFTRRFAAEKKGEKKSLRQLSEGLEISPIGLSRVFRSVKVKPMYKPRGKN